MMLSALLAVTLYALTATTSAYSSSAAPDCVSKCWTYSQYLSLSCKGETKCLCEDAEFQNAVYQCLYSQCSTSKFGTALHHALGYCAGNDAKPALISTAPSLPSPLPTAVHQPAMLRNEGVQKRAGALANGANTKSVTRTHTHHHSVSKSAHNTHTASRAIVTEIGDGQPQAPAAIPTGQPKVPANAVYRMAHDRHHGKWQEKHPKHDKWTELPKLRDVLEDTSKDL